MLSLERVSKTRPIVTAPWMDLSNQAERRFAEAFGMTAPGGVKNERYLSYLINIDPTRQEGVHYELSKSLESTISKAAESVHAMFMEVTNRVIASDELLRHCSIPEAYWPRIRDSWQRRQASLSGRFDFIFDGKEGLYCLEYNADSASTALECGQLQQKTAIALGIDKNSVSSGWRLASYFQDAWRSSGASGRVHFCVEDDGEEEYTALFVMDSARAVGLQPRLCVNFDDFRFTDDGTIVDAEGVPVRFVWKTWMWETAINDEKKAQAERGASWKPSPASKVRLCDLMFHPAIQQFEPLWKVVTSNKALLPLLYEANRGHPNVLPASYTLTDALRAKGYAKKPIVGRIGENVQLMDGSGEQVEQTSGRFGARDMVYQQLVRNPVRDGRSAVLGAWIVNGRYGGTGIREDAAIITGPFSSFAPIRIVDDTKKA